MNSVVIASLYVCIAAVTEEGKKDPKSMKASHFFRREYMLNHLIGEGFGRQCNYIITLINK